MEFLALGWPRNVPEGLARGMMREGLASVWGEGKNRDTRGNCPADSGELSFLPFILFIRFNKK